MVASLCLVINRNNTESKETGTIIMVMACVVLYYICWLCYYQGNAETVVLIGLTVFPCAAFLIYSYKRRNMIAAFLAGVFSMCHLIYTIANFIVYQEEIMLKNLEIYKQAVGDRIQAICISGTDFGTQRGLFMSKDTFRSLYKPHYKVVMTGSTTTQTGRLTIIPAAALTTCWMILWRWALTA